MINSVAPKRSLPAKLSIDARKAISSLCLASLLLGSVAVLSPQDADARPRYRGYSRYDRGYGQRNQPMFSYKTKKILKGGLIGAGVGAGSALVFDKPVLKSGLVGAGVGAGIQAIRYW